jgi:osmotically inducible protein OsmC
MLVSSSVGLSVPHHTMSFRSEPAAGRLEGLRIDNPSARTQIEEESTMKRQASAVWTGGLKDGRGTISAPSGVLKDTPYSFQTRFEDSPGTNPEELIAAAHAGCFTMALSGQLGTANLTAEKLQTTASVTMEKLDAGWTVTTIHLDVTARIPGATDPVFQEKAKAAKEGCPISRLLNANITMQARLES